MKNTFTVFLIVLMLVAGGGVARVHSQSYQFGGYGPHLIAGTVGVIGGGAMMFASEDSEDLGFTIGTIFLVAGGLDLLLGFIFFCLDAPAFVQAIEEDPVLRHVSLEIKRSSVFLGTKISF